MSDTLLLNASYEPLRVITRRRAVVLVLKEKAEVVVQETTAALRSAHTSIPIPSVIRLVKMVRVPYRTRIPLSRRALIARDKGLCQYCFKPGNTKDHVHPRSRGGADTWENVVLACESCNGRKGDKTLEQLGWKLKRKPYAPKGTQWLVVVVGQLDPSWEPYLAAVG